MALGSTLGEILDLYRAESGNSLGVSSGIDSRESEKKIIRRIYETLYDAWDWPHLLVMPTKDLADAQRYYDMPSTLNFERIIDVTVIYSSTPHPIERGISFEDYATYDSDAGDKSSPVRKWDLRRTSDTATQIEVWPIPADNNMKLFFRGLRPLPAFTDEDDLAVLDDQLIALHAAAETLAKQKSTNAEMVAGAARGRFNQLKTRYQGGSRQVTYGGGNARQTQRGRSIIRVGS